MVPQVLHVGKIRLGTFARDMDHLALWSLEGTPDGDLSLESAHLSWAIAIRMALTEPRKQGGSLQGWIGLQFGDHPGPIFLERVGSGPPGGRFNSDGNLLARSYLWAVCLPIPALAAARAWMSPLRRYCINNLTSVSFFMTLISL